MAALVEGHTYGLSSFSSSNSNKSALHVKLTDSALRALEEFQKIKDVTSRRPKIQFCNSNGVIKVPIRKSSDNPEGYRMFHFSLSTIQGDPKGGFDCAKQKQVSNGDGDGLSIVNAMTHRVIVRATDDVFDDTKKKMTLAEEESKKQCAKEIKPGARNISKKVKKIVKRENLDLNLRPSSEVHHPRLHAPSSHSPTSVIRPVTQKPTSLDRASPVSSLHTKSHHTLQGSKASDSPYHHKANKSPVMHLPLRDRMIHLLALRPYKKPELLAKLCGEGIRDKDKSMFNTVLKTVGGFNPRDNSFSLSKHLYAEVNPDWLAYTEADRQLLKRKRVSDSSSSSPAASLSPVQTNCSLSPTSSQKRPSSSSDYEVVVTKKARVAHEPRGQHSDANQNKKNPESKTGFQQLTHSANTSKPKAVMGSKPAVKVKSPHTKRKETKAISPDSSKGHSPDSTTPPDCNLDAKKRLAAQEHLEADTDSSQLHASSTSETPDYILQFKPIISREQRSHYKEEFNSNYDHYLELHTNVDQVTQKFKNLENLLRNVKEGSEDYQNVKNKIVGEYRSVKNDKKYVDQRKKCNYLHKKLAHIKRLILEFDQSVISQS